MTKKPKPAPTGPVRLGRLLLAGLTLAILAAISALILLKEKGAPEEVTEVASAPEQPRGKWIERAELVSQKFHEVYTPCWEGAYGAIGDAYLFAASHDSSLIWFHLLDHDLRKMCTGTWVDDRAWVCLAELAWWRVTGKRNLNLVADAEHRYDEARGEGRLSSHDGFWSWYNWPPRSGVKERIFSNSAMNQMATVACKLFEATGVRRYLDDALLVWNGDGRLPGVEKVFYRGGGRWQGGGGHAAFGNPLPWGGTAYCSLAAALYHATGVAKYKEIAVATARHITDPATGWVDPFDFYQIHMDGSGAFVNYLLDAYEVAPEELGDLLLKIKKMLEHVWTNHDGRASVTLHRLSDNGIRNGWNPDGGEEGYGVGEIGTVHAQGEAARAFGVFAYYWHRDGKMIDSTRVP
jgi:hypothetical protein